ncbi:MAG: LPS assembly lipoprotein LptE [Syntrophales bacterium]|nr:LPS assembly lipoprotein LptE [Syntrophales bacterium]
MHRILFSITLVGTVLAIIVGCGYQFGTGEVNSKDVVLSIYVAPFENRTREAYLHNFLRNALVDWFIKATRFRVVTREEEADLTLEGKIRLMHTLPVSYRSGNLAAEEKVHVSMEVTLKDRRTGRIIWEEKNMTGEQEYSVADPNRREDSRRAALIKLAHDLGERIYRPATTKF